MNEDKLFVIGIGGTGMRCLESFVHMCAMGMFDNKEINILTLDTDQENGNLKRVWDLIDLYNRIKNPTGNNLTGDSVALSSYNFKLIGLEQGLRNYK